MTGGRSDPIHWAELADWTSAAAGITLNGAQLDQLRAYVDTLLSWNRKLSLVSQHDPRQIVAKHIADSLFAAGHCEEGESIVDLGSGGGFPALPIAIARRGARVVLIESRGAKVSFLEEACRTASIRNASVRHARIEALGREATQQSRYQVATARALAATAEIASLARPFLTGRGRIIAMRSVGEDHATEPTGAREIPYELPDGTKRRLLILEGGAPIRERQDGCGRV
jgi:16S rRNA (guanine527-N7)-methyltransferase